MLTGIARGESMPLVWLGILYGVAAMVGSYWLFDYLMPRPKVQFVAHYIQSAGKTVPVWIANARFNGRRPGNRYLLYLVGGPNGWARPDEIPSGSRKLLVEQARRGISPVIVAYAGTKERSYFPQADMPEAVDDVRIAIEYLQRQDAGAKFCLLGESLGGYLTLKYLEEKVISDAVSGYILVNPLVISPEKQFNIFLSERDGRRMWYWSIKKFARNPKGDDYLGPIDELRTEIFSNFFGAEYLASPVTSTGRDGLFKRVFLSSDKNPSMRQNIEATKHIWGKEYIVNTWSSNHSLEVDRILFYLDKRRIATEISKCFEYQV